MSKPENTEANHPLPRSMRTRKPWPMWPIGLAIVLFIGGYTWINLEYRKEGQAFEPFQAMMDRKNAIVEKNMYDWYGLTAKRSAQNDEILNTAEISAQPQEDVLDEIVPEQLKYYMPGRPLLVPSYSKIESPKSLVPGQHLRLRIHLPEGIANDERLNLLAFYKEGDLYLLPSLFAESLEDFAEDAFKGETAPVSFEIPTDPIEGEVAHVRLLTEGQLTRWEIAVTPATQ